ncbi:MAG: hypothetical protein JO359_08400 [Candidatus Eremiobacteraeota bacterium]|nr:hypothetical protein [Candidatus Eremiobacteraeota bacterium]
MTSLPDELAELQDAEFQRLSGHSIRDASALHAALGHVLRGYRYLELIHQRHVPTAKRYKELLAQLIARMDPAFEGGAIAYDDEMAAMDAEMGDLLDVAHLDLETFYLFAKTVLERVAQYVELYFGPEPKLQVRSHEKLKANFDEYAIRRGIVIPDDLRSALSTVHEMVFAHRADSATNEARAAQSPSDLMIAHTDAHPGPNGSTGGVMRLSLTTGQLLAVVDAYLRSIVDLIRRNPNRARTLRKRRAPRELPAAEFAAVAQS